MQVLAMIDARTGNRQLAKYKQDVYKRQTYGYLEAECGITVPYKPQTVEIYDKVFYLAHGDGLGDPDKKFKFLKRMFQNQRCV